MCSEMCECILSSVFETHSFWSFPGLFFDFTFCCFLPIQKSFISARMISRIAFMLAFPSLLVPLAKTSWLLDLDFAYLAMKACSYHGLPSVLNQFCQVNRHLYSQIWRRFSLKLPFLQPLNRETILMVIFHFCSLWNVKSQTCSLMWCARVPIDSHLNFFRLSWTSVACLTQKMKHQPLFK